jgi:glutathione synthase
MIALPKVLNDTCLTKLINRLYYKWSIAHGLAVRPAPSFVPQQTDPTGVLATTAPVTLFPSLFPQSCFRTACSIQEAYNELYSAIARDEEWLKSIVEE